MKKIIALTILALFAAFAMGTYVADSYRYALVTAYPSGRTVHVLNPDLSNSECNARTAGWNRGARLISPGEYRNGLRAVCARRDDSQSYARASIPGAIGNSITVIFGLIISLGMLALAFAVYFLPAIIATKRGRAVVPIWFTNLFFGWTFVGWAVALIWAVTARSDTEEAARAAPSPV